MTIGLRPGLVILIALSLFIVAFARTATGAEAALDQALAARGIGNARVLEAFRRVRRDAFVPAAARERSSDDGTGQPSPYLLARMGELLDLAPTQRVMAVGTGNGYAAAILGELAQEVYSVEAIPELATTARLRLTREGYRNVHVKLGDAALGWREYAPFDAILVTTVGPRVPQALVDQLVEGGVLVMAMGPPRGRQVLVRGVKKGFKLHAREMGELRPATKSPRDDGSGRARTPSGGRREPAGDVREGRPPRDADDSRNDR